MPTPDRGAPAVTVVVLTWNRESLLRETLDSVLAQTLSDIEVLVVDNESTDGTRSFVEGHSDPRVRYLRNANGGNLSVNRNHGVRHARGSWVAFCDDDDLWEPEKLERQMDEVARTPDAAIVSTDAVYFSREAGVETVYGPLIGREADGDVTLDDLLTGYDDVVISSVMVRRDIFDDVAMFDEDPAVFTIEDYQLWTKAASRGYRIRFVARPLVRYRVHPEMTSHRDSRVTVRKERAMFAGLHRDGFIDDEMHSRVGRALSRKMRAATLKEWLKAVPGVKSAVYGARAVRHLRGERG